MSANNDAARKAAEAAEKAERTRKAEELRKYNEEYARKQKAHEEMLRRQREANRPWDHD